MNYAKVLKHFPTGHQALHFDETDRGVCTL